MSNLEVAPQETDCTSTPANGTLLIEARTVPLGGVRGITVNRTLPSRQVPTIGAWCFVDHFGPAPADSMVVLPHPHTALQTVTWPLTGSIHHRDSVGSDVIVRPGELNLMTAGHGVSHSEISLVGPDPLRGLQLWLALPDDALNAAPAFEQHTGLPIVETGTLTATVLTGEFAGARSPATTYTPVVGAQLSLRPGTSTIELEPGFEYGLMVLDGPVRVDGRALPDGDLLYLGPGHQGVELSTTTGSRMIMLGGEPFEAELIMWWNFIGRNHQDILRARQEWEDHSVRFGTVAGHGSERIPAPPMPITILKPRRRNKPVRRTDWRGRPMTITVTDVPEKHRYEATDENGRVYGHVEYLRGTDLITFTHTEVDPAAEGKGIGGTLARAVLDQARADGVLVRPICPFIKEWIARHPDYADLVRRPR
jgi:redox-sensitive bicupin YhaK (pirin superfamily)/predicted GNAT family acetyltransferase